MSTFAQTTKTHAEMIQTCRSHIQPNQNPQATKLKRINMSKKLSMTIAVTATILASSCASHYEMQDVSRSRILVDSRYDRPNGETERFIAPYRAKVDSVMTPVVGTTAKALECRQPESPLSNLLADILLEAGKDFNEKPDFAVYNMGGIRAAFAKGNITYGDVLDVAPFENKICFCSLTGEKVIELFRQMASWGGQAVSHGVEAVINKDNKLVSVKLNGEEIAPNREYRIATLDYLAEGNDRLVAFKSKTKVNSPSGTENNVRELIVKYFKAAASKGIPVDADVEGRFVKTK